MTFGDGRIIPHRTSPDFVMNPGVPYPLRDLQRVRVLTSAMKNKLERRYGFSDLHFITFSCYRRMPLLPHPMRAISF